MRNFFCIMVFTSCLETAFSQSAELKGRIIDGQTDKPLRGATIVIKGHLVSATTDQEGLYSFPKLNTEKTILIISYVGYETKELLVNISEGQNAIADIVLNVIYRIGDDIVVSASKRPEKITDAPASIQAVTRKDIEQFTGSNTFEVLSKLQGVEFIRTGVDYSLMNARGMNNAFNNKVFQIADNRNSITPLSGSLPMQNGFTLTKDDIERIEVVLGPQTALYGPNAHNAIINFITRDPRKTQGTTLSLSAGNRYQFSGRIRNATRINHRWAYKLSGEYALGHEFEFYDSVYAGGGPNKVFGDTVAIPERNINFDFRHIRGEAHIYYSIHAGTDIIVTAGGSNNNFFSTHTNGRLQVKGMKYGFLQGRYVSNNFFVNIYNTWATIGDSYNLNPHTMDYWNRTHSLATSGPFRRLTPEEAEVNAMRYGIRVKEHSKRFNGEVQYNTKFEKAGLVLVAGVSYQQDRPHAYGIALVDSFQRIKITQYGSALQLEKSLPWQLRFVGAARWDHHNNFGNFFSPKLGLVKKIGEGNIRLTWGRAYSMPTIVFQYGNINGLFYGNGEGITYIPNLTKMSESVRKITQPLKPEEVSTWELGYKGSISKNVYVDISGYNGLSKNFFSPSVTVPGRALFIGDAPATPLFPGQVTNDTLKGAQFLTVFNFGDVRVYGADAGITYEFNRFVSFAVRYSWLGSDISEGHADNDANKDDTVSVDERSLNSPTDRLVVLLNFQNLCKQKLFVNLSTRYTSQYDFYSGNQISTAAGEGKRGYVQGAHGARYLKNFDWGPLAGFTIIDLSAQYKLTSITSIGMNVTNLFDKAQREFAGSPTIGRIITFELRVNLHKVNNPTAR